ncbi:MAG: caspase family protein, partial [Sulfurimicrobium sp.]|nr:caspase family protein [Sulfurimicrobium sp.]
MTPYRPFLYYLLALILAAWPLSAPAADSPKRLALVVGNAAYPGSPLENPVNDAHAIAVSLKELGFHVTALANLSQREFNRAITLFGEQLTPNTVALFYYAGHGMQVRGKNYLIPVDAQIHTEAGVKSEAVDVDTLLEHFQSAGSPLNIVILDACRNNPFERRFRSTAGAGLAQMDAPKGTLVAYATAPGKTALDGEGANGVYTTELLRAVRQPGLKVEDVFKQVRIRVAALTADQQMPWEASSLTGDFYFTHPAS